MATERAKIFIDGNNWYHGLKAANVADRFNLDYAKISAKLVGPRHWLETRYYIGRADRGWNEKDYANQRSFLARIKNDDPKRITAHLGRLEKQRIDSNLAEKILHLLADPEIRFEDDAYKMLHKMASEHRVQFTLVEKAVDVMIAVDIVTGAERDEYDTAYLLSADGDFTPAVAAARKLGKTIFAASMQHGHQLKQAVNTFIFLERPWFDDCYRPVKSRQR